ncbi:DUF1194 domain-containing protein [Sulfitobacter sp. JB4-11]|uniref:DUF1194 domain-containing protein n=1 Tax=Sulfitobacter rhodophyticola TaxID=3238304 RepID=UPI003512072E
MAALGAGVVAGALLAGDAAAQCRLALLLGLDISSSVDAGEDDLQRGGMAAALRAPEVQAAFFAADQQVALAAFEWSGRYNQELLLDWTMIEAPADLERAADVIAASRRSYGEFPTAMGEALAFGAELMARAPACLGQTIDMAGDGENNEGPGPAMAYALPAFGAITVNGLVVANAAEFQTEDRLTAYYRDNVLHGAGAFMVVADGFDDYLRAMRKKLEREVRPPTIGALAPAEQAG